MIRSWRFPEAQRREYFSLPEVSEVKKNGKKGEKNLSESPDAVGTMVQSGG
jgi:hypothetical protein